MVLPTMDRIQLAKLNEIPQRHLFRTTRPNFFTSGMESKEKRCRRNGQLVGCVPLLNAPSLFPILRRGGEMHGAPYGAIPPSRKWCAFEHTVAIPHTRKRCVEKRDVRYSKKKPRKRSSSGAEIVRV